MPPPAPRLTERSLRELLDAVAAQTPAPGGGSSAACAGALAAGLIEMAAKFTLARETYADRHPRAAAIRDRAAELRERLLELAERELHAYEPVLEALRLPPEDPDRAARIGDARADAAQSPLEIARLAAELAELGAETTRTGSPHLAGDAITGAVLAEAACRAAARLVEINLAAAPDDRRVREAAELAQRALSARSTALE